MKLKDAFVVIGCPLSPTFRADARTVGMLEAWKSQTSITYYPSSGASEIGYDMIVKFAQSVTPKPTHILFVDYDVLPRSNTLKKLLEHDKDIVCGIYPIVQRFKISWCLSNEEPFKLMDIADLPANPFKAKVGSNGMMLVKMEVFENLEWPYWKNKYFTEGIKMGADIYFFDKVRKAGYDVWIDPKIKCSHFKMVDLLGIVQNYNFKE